MVEKKDEIPTKSRRKRAKYLDSSVKKLFILAITKGIPETYHNVKIILKALRLQRITFDFCLTTDLKLMNIIMGIQSNSATYPCVFCESPRPFTTKGLVRTLGSLRKLYEEFQNSGGKKKDAKDYCNVINLPLFEGDDELSVIEILAIPELHLLIGIGKNMLAAQNFRHFFVFKKNFFFSQQDIWFVK